jgi:hypothetical protein
MILSVYSLAFSLSVRNIPLFNRVIPTIAANVATMDTDYIGRLWFVSETEDGNPAFSPIRPDGSEQKSTSGLTPVPSVVALNGQHIAYVSMGASAELRWWYLTSGSTVLI